jgi:hypothetical protein
MDTSVMDTHLNLDAHPPAPPDMVTILAFDPGKITGWASLRLGEFFSGQDDLQKILEWVESLVRNRLQPVIVCEDFIYTAATAQKTRQTWSTEGIGTLRFLANKYDLPFHLQTPQAAKSFSTNDKLKRIGWYQATKGGHANDAARHLLLYCVERGLVEPRALI